MSPFALGASLPLTFLHLPHRSGKRKRILPLPWGGRAAALGEAEEADAEATRWQTAPVLPPQPCPAASVSLSHHPALLEPQDRQQKDDKKCLMEFRHHWFSFYFFFSSLRCETKRDQRLRWNLV